MEFKLLICQKQLKAKVFEKISFKTLSMNFFAISQKYCQNLDDILLCYYILRSQNIIHYMVRPRLIFI